MNPCAVRPHHLLRMVRSYCSGSVVHECAHNGYCVELVRSSFRHGRLLHPQSSLLLVRSGGFCKPFCLVLMRSTAWQEESWIPTIAVASCPTFIASLRDFTHSVQSVCVYLFRGNFRAHMRPWQCVYRFDLQYHSTKWSQKLCHIFRTLMRTNNPKTVEEGVGSWAEHGKRHDLDFERIQHFINARLTERWPQGRRGSNHAKYGVA